MEKSKYTYVVSNDNNVLLFNCIKSTCIVLTQKEYKKFLENSLNKKLTNQLKDLGFYIDDGYSEIDELMFKSKLVVDNDRRRFYRIYTTLNCNGNCPYCFEKNQVRGSMDLKIAENVAKFIEKTTIENNEILVEWFGGEPLVNEKIIDYLSKRISCIAREKNTTFTSRLITNGLLLDDEKIKKAKKLWHLKFVQITLDGMKDNYEKIKGFKTKNSFDIVINNIKELLKANIFVNIRLNYDENNLNEILDLIDFLTEELQNYSRYNIYAKKIMADEMDNSVVGSENTDLIILNKLLEKKVFKDIIGSIPQRLNTCVANMINSYMILPDGKIAKCSQAASKADYVGDISQGCNIEKLVKWCTPRLPKKCLDCKLVPLCNGGCLFEKFRNKNYCFLSEKILLFKLKYFLDNVFEKENHEIRNEKR